MSATQIGTPSCAREAILSDSATRAEFLQFCLRWTHGNIFDAEDLLSEAWLRVFEHDGRTAAIEKPTAYLSTVIVNIAKDRRRSARHGSSHSVDDEHYPSRDTAPDERAAQRETLVRVSSSLSHLSEKQRDALLLRALGHEYPVIAQCMGTTPVNARKLVQFARSRIGARH